MVINPQKCIACKKPIQSKNGIEGNGNPYYVTCKECGAKNEIIKTSGGNGEPLNFSVVKLFP
jgi:transcription elongation factor Elf1